MLCISLDFELGWGIDLQELKNGYDENIYGAKLAAQSILNLFEEKNIKATWGIVGLLGYDSYTSAVEQLSTYEGCNCASSQLEKIDHYKNNYLDLFSAKSEITKLQSYSHEVASHTFSHYHRFDGDSTNFELDLKLFDENVRGAVSTIIFPRNQVKGFDYKVCSNYFTAFRGCFPHWAYEESDFFFFRFIQKPFRLLDSYFNLSRLNVGLVSNKDDELANIPGTCFLRPFKSGRLGCFLNEIRVRRIKSAMTDAAKHNRLFHLWWHPHNFGTNLDLNLFYLRNILEHYEYLNKQYGMKCHTMSELKNMGLSYDKN